MNICALSTGKGGAIAVIRVSGPDAIRIVSGHFVPAKPGRSLAEAAGQTLHYGTFANIDDVLVSIFRAPHSYTGENSTEISCHGSPFIISSILQRLIDSGCRQANPGEFTQRAFLNGKMDLSQAEAVADLIAATNRATHHLAMNQLRGGISSELATLRDNLLHLTSLLELELDFSDHEDLEFADRSRIQALAEAIELRIDRLIQSFQAGRAIKQGVPVAIVGKTNVGKSTLLNRLLKEERAIVSDIHGTTRDTIEDCIDIHGVTFRFIDTAGLRKTDDTIERIGIERTYNAMQKARIILWVIDGSPSQTEMDEMTKLSDGKELLIVRNKVDLQHNHCESDSCIPISAREGTGLSLLEEKIYRAAHIPEIAEDSIVVTNARHYQSLLSAHESLQRVLAGLSDSLPADLLAEDLRLVLDHLADITGGQITPQETLETIFREFCIGK